MKLCAYALAATLVAAVAVADADFVVLDALRPGVIRARVTQSGKTFDPSKPGAVVETMQPMETVSGTGAISISAGPLQASVDADSGLLEFTRTDDAKFPNVLTEKARSWSNGGISCSFDLPDRVYAFGEHQNSQLDSRGLTFDMETCTEYAKSHGGEVCLPFVLHVSNETNVPHAGLLWNMPNFGGVSFGAHGSLNETWTALSATQFDVVVSVPLQPPSEQPLEAANDVMDGYTFATGKAPHLPPAIAGYIHSRNRYSSQDELEQALQGFENRSIPLSMIVIDYFNWPQNGMGDWRFDPTAWPDPDAMQRYAASLNVSLMVSAWPFTVGGSDTYDYMATTGLVVVNMSAPQSNGTFPPILWHDGVCGSPCHLYDPSQEAARSFFWSRLAGGYAVHGIEHFWLDAAEPENQYGFPAGAGFAAGTQEEVGMMFPFWHTQSVYDGLRGMGRGDGEIWMLTRSAWAGMQRHAASLWSGDTQSDWPSLQRSVPAGLNAQMSGIAWWTLDIGGYNNGDPSNQEFNRLLVRWFQYGLTLPVFRQHGHRETEPWVLANATCYSLVVRSIRQRYQLAPYVLAELNRTTERGTPLQRPLWWDFPSDANTAGVTDAYMFGSGFLARPVVQDGVTQVQVYLPAGDSWVECATGATMQGGQTVTAQADLGTLPLFKRASLASQTDALLKQGAADPRTGPAPLIC